MEVGFSMKLKRLPEVQQNTNKCRKLFARDEADSIANFIRNKNKIMSQPMSSEEQDVYAYCIYGEGGIGKTCILRLLADQFKADRFCIIYYDLIKNTNHADKLYDLSNLIRNSLKKPNMFSEFDSKYSEYVSKLGSVICPSEQEDLKGAVTNAVVNTISCVPGMPDVSGFVSAFKDLRNVVSLARKGEKSFFSSDFSWDKIDEELNVSFARDLNRYLDRYPDVRLVFLMDTLESLQYRTQESDEGKDVFDWLFGETGIVCLVQHSFWVFAGREAVEWEKYDSQSYTDSFVNQLVKQPEREILERYLKELEFNEISVKKILDEIGCYPAKLGICLDFLFERGQGENPGLDEVEMVISAVKGSARLTNRFLLYFNRQEREVIFTLICLRQWTDEFLREIVWKDSINKFSLYEAVRNFSFIKKEHGIYELSPKTLSVDIINSVMTNCPSYLKNKLSEMIRSVLNENTSLRLMNSFIHIILYCDSGIDTAIKFFNDWMHYLVHEENVQTAGDELAVCLSMLQECGGESDLYFAVLVWKFILAEIDVFNRELNYSSEECLSSLKGLTSSGVGEIAVAIRYVSIWLSYYGRYQSAYDFIQITEKWGSEYEIFEERQIAVAKLYYYSWQKSIQYLENEKYQLIGNISPDMMLYNLEEAIQVAEEKILQYREDLFNLIRMYVNVVMPISQLTFTIRVVPSQEEIDRCDNYVRLFEEVADRDNISEKVSLALLEFQVAYRKDEMEKAYSVMFQCIYYLVSEGSVWDYDIEVFEELCSRISMALRTRGFRDSRVPDEHLQVWQILFSKVMVKFCETYESSYYSIVMSSLGIAKSVLEDFAGSIEPYLKRLEMRAADGLRCRIAMSVVYHEISAGFSMSVFVKEDREEEVVLVAKESLNDNYILYEVLQRLRNEDIELFIQFIDQIFYDGAGFYREKLHLLYQILTVIEDSLCREVSTIGSYFVGWHKDLDYKTNRKVNEQILKYLLAYQGDWSGRSFCSAVQKALKFESQLDKTVACQILIKFLDRSDNQLWIDSVDVGYDVCLYNEKLRNDLIRYELLEPILYETFSIEEVVNEGYDKVMERMRWLTEIRDEDFVRAFLLSTIAAGGNAYRVLLLHYELFKKFISVEEVFSGDVSGVLHNDLDWEDFIESFHSSLSKEEMKLVLAKFFNPEDWFGGGQTNVFIYWSSFGNGSRGYELLQEIFGDGIVPLFEVKFPGFVDVKSRHKEAFVMRV